MKKFQLFRYLKKWRLLIILFCVGMTSMAYQILEKRQQYVASSVIEYSNEEAKDGLAPDNTQINVSEIYSSSNMAKAMENLGLSPEAYGLDILCAGIHVEPIIEEQAVNIQEAVNEEGEEYTVQPTAYTVSCTLDSSGSEELARNILNELLDVYFSDFSKKHINQEQVDNHTKDLVDKDYDYLEMVENIDAQLGASVDALNGRYLRAWNFRSASTGYSFADLRDQFDLLRNVDISRLYSLILGNQITKDRELLLDKYRNRIANYNLDGTKAQEDMADIQQVIDSYVDKMRESGNTNIDFNYILSDVYDREWLKEENDYKPPNRTVQYDTLLRSWIGSHNDWDYAQIDAAYCSYVIGVYQSDEAIAENTEAEGEDRPLQAETIPSVSLPEAGRFVSKETVEEEIGAVISRMNDLYDIVTKTNEEYNEYLGAANIRILSGTQVHPAFSMKLYMAIVAVFFLLVGCCGAILLGRIGDILEYAFLRDGSTGCMNRVSCDHYIQEHENRVLPLGMCCLNLQITNQRELNDIYGRQETDQALKEVGRILLEILGNRKDSFVAYNGSGQFWAFFIKEEAETVEQEVRRLGIILAQSLSHLPVAYQMGAVNVGERALYRIRGLLSGALKERKSYLTGEGEAPGQKQERKKDRTEDEDERA